jgi:hypothetical protein
MKEEVGHHTVSWLHQTRQRWSAPLRKKHYHRHEARPVPAFTTRITSVRRFLDTITSSKTKTKTKTKNSRLSFADHESGFLLDEHLLYHTHRSNTLASRVTFPEHFGVDYFDTPGWFANNASKNQVYASPTKRAFCVGGKGARSSLHVDMYNWTGWNALVVGSKRWRFLPPSTSPDTTYSYRNPNKRGFIAGYKSAATLFHSQGKCVVVPLAFPNLRHAVVYETIQKPGEVVMIPPGWWHETLHLGFTTAIASQFANAQNIDGILQELRRWNTPHTSCLGQSYNELTSFDKSRVLMRCVQKTYEPIKRGSHKTFLNRPVRRNWAGCQETVGLSREFNVTYYLYAYGLHKKPFFFRDAPSHSERILRHWLTIGKRLGLSGCEGCCDAQRVFVSKDLQYTVIKNGKGLYVPVDVHEFNVSAVRKLRPADLQVTWVKIDVSKNYEMLKWGTLPVLTSAPHKTLLTGGDVLWQHAASVVHSEPIFDGFIFHMSRCGSTLAAQMIAAVPGNVVVSEPEVVNAIMDHVRDDTISVELTRNVLLAYVQQKHKSKPQKYFIKFSSGLRVYNATATDYMSIILRAFPKTPWIFVYRDPREVLVSNLRTMSKAVADANFSAAVTADAVAWRIAESVRATILHYDRDARYQQSDKAPMLLVPYTRLVPHMLTQVAHLFGMGRRRSTVPLISPLTAKERRSMLRVTLYKRKQKDNVTGERISIRFVPDSQEKQEEARREGSKVGAAVLRYLGDEHNRGVYHTLSNLNTRQPVP